jgi:hypothetical protein
MAVEGLTDCISVSKDVFKHNRPAFLPERICRTSATDFNFTGQKLSSIFKWYYFKNK